MRTLLALTLALLLLPAVAAHGPPSRRDADTRVLVDWNDDCGGDGGAATGAGACRGSHDLLGLDLVERHDAELGDVVVFRVYMDRGQSGSHRDTLTVGTPSGQQAFALTSSDHSAFSNTGFDRLGSAQSLNDGTRFVVEGTVKLSRLGRAGDTIGPFKMEAYTGTSVGDYMPGGCNNLVGTCPTPAPDADIAYELKQYRLAGPTHYVAIEAPTETQAVKVGADTFVQVKLTNRLAHTAQTLHLSAAPADGVEVGFHTGGTTAGATASPTASVDLAAKADTNVHLMLRGTDAGDSGAVRVTVETDQGGYQTFEVPYGVSTAATTGGPSSTGTQGTSSRPAAAPPLAFLAVAVALALAARRAR